MRFLGWFVTTAAISLFARCLADGSSSEHTDINNVQCGIEDSSADSTGGSSHDDQSIRWVRDWVGTPTDSACYRKTYRAHECTRGYKLDKLGTCWAECPLEYPVKCGMECLPQNQDCTKAILRKVSSVATAALNLATSGMFGRLTKVAKGLQHGVACGQGLHSVIKDIVDFVAQAETADKTKDAIIVALSKKEVVTRNLPMAITKCLGPTTSTGLDDTSARAQVVDRVLHRVVASSLNGEDLLSAEAFLNFAASVGLGDSIGNATGISKERELIAVDVACGRKIKDTVDRVTTMVSEMKGQDATTSQEKIRLAVMGSPLFLKDIPASVASCTSRMPRDAKGSSRGKILKTITAVVDGVIEASSKSGQPVSKEAYALAVADMGLDTLATLDPTGLVDMAQEFLQPICGPSVLLDDIDDGSAEDAVGLRTMQKAFRGSTGNWTATGDGKLRVTFASVDDKDVTVHVKAGGETVDDVKVGRGQTVHWTRSLAEIRGRTLYMDRSRPGFLGVPGKGGGSLLLWIPGNPRGGLQLEVVVNPTSPSNKD